MARVLSAGSGVVLAVKLRPWLGLLGAADAAGNALRERLRTLSIPGRRQALEVGWACHETADASFPPRLGLQRQPLQSMKKNTCRG
jgi:hypothetical protein